MGLSLQLHRQCIFKGQRSVDLTLSKEAYRADRLYIVPISGTVCFISPHSVIKIKSLIYCIFSRSTASVISTHVVFVCTWSVPLSIYFMTNS
jgi:hypothetical protein